MKGITRTSRIAALVFALIVALAAIAAWPPRVAGAEGPDVPAAPAVDTSAGSPEELSPSALEDPTVSVQDAAGDPAPVNEEASATGLSVTEPINSIIPQAPDAGLPPDQPREPDPLDPITDLLPPPPAETPEPLDPVTELLPLPPAETPVPLDPVTELLPLPPAETPVPLDPVTELLPLPPAETPVPLDPVTELLPLPPAETPVPLDPVTEVLPLPPAETPVHLDPVTELLPLPPAETPLPLDPVSGLLPPSPAETPAPIGSLLPPPEAAQPDPTDPLSGIVPVEPDVPVLPGDPAESTPVPTEPIAGLVPPTLASPPASESPAGADNTGRGPPASQPTAALPTDVSATHTRTAGDKSLTASEQSVKARERARTRSRTSRARVTSTSNAPTDTSLPAGGVAKSSEIDSLGGGARPRGLPDDGTGMFVPSTISDAVAMVATGLVALLLVWFWLRQQRRGDELLPEFPGDLYGDDSPGLLLPSTLDGSLPALSDGEGHTYVGLFSPTIALANGHSYGISTATALRHAPVLAPPASTPDVPPTAARVSVVIPAKNEEKNLPALLDALPTWLHEVILVDGLSSDATSDVARRHLSNIRIISQKGRGKGNALREGFAHCTGDVIVAIDADGSMDPEEISTFVAFLESGFDYVKGSRMLPGGGSHDLTPFRRLGNWFFRSLTNALYTSNYSDLCYGYFGFRRGTIDALDLRSDGFEIETEINIKAHTAGFRTAEIPSTESPRVNGKSNLRALRDGLRILRTILVAQRGDG